MSLSPVLLAADSVAGQSSFLRDIPSGKYEAFFLMLSGTADSTQQLTEAGFGRIRLTEANRDLVSVDFDNLLQINELKGGTALTVNGAGAAHEFGVVIPRGYYDDNLQQVNESEIVQIQIQYGGTFTTVFPGTVTATQKVYGLVRETGLMSYNLLIHQFDNTYGAGNFTLPVRNENVLALYVVPSAGNLDRFRILQDNEEKANISAPDHLFLSDLLNRFEGATASAIQEVGIAEPGEIGEFLSDDLVIEYVTSPATTYVQETVVMSADFTPTKLRQTKNDTAAVVQRKMSRKNLLGRGRPVQTLRIAAE